MACLYVEVVKVNPTTKRIDDNEAKNTETRVWLESGPWLQGEKLNEFDRKHCPNGMPSHDIKLDCGASNFEKAIIKLANLVLRHYGDGRSGQ